MILNDPKIIAEVEAEFYRYEKALMENDVEIMDNIFHNSPSTVRFGVGEVLLGYDEIAAFRKSRGGSPQRKLGRVVIASYGNDFATADAEFFREGSEKRGRQSQSWVRFADGWRVVSAHVSIEGVGS